MGGDLQLLAVLGQGGVGTVYRARSARGGREVALKVLTGSGTPAQRERLRREAEITAALDHPGIVRLLGHGDEEGTPYLIYELIEGRPLEGLLDQLGRAEAVRVVRDVAAALGYAHARGVVHRDVKPGNVLLERDGRVRVVDFGLGWAGELTRLTRTGALLGTPLYMSPEQVRDPRQVGPPSDVWSVGVILYQVLTGRRPFRGDSLQELLHQVALASPAPPRALDPAIPAALDRICLRALAPDPQQRYPDGSSLARELSAWLEEVGVVPPSRTRLPARPGPAPRPTSGRLVVTALGLLAVGLAAGLALLLRPRAPVAATPHASAAPPPTLIGSPSASPAPIALPESTGPAPGAHPLHPALVEADALMADGLLAAALRALERAPEDVARTWLLRGLAHRDLGDLPRALECLDHALRLGPDDGEALVQRGHLWSLLGQPARGLPDLRRASQVAPREHQSWHYLGLALMESDLPDEARAAFDRALELEPGFASTWVNRGSCRGRTRDFAGAVADYTQALALEPTHRGALEWRARCLLQLGRPAEALADLDRALALGAEGRDLRLDRATALERLGRQLEGLPDVERAVALAPDDLEALLRRGQVRGNAGDPAGSLEDVERYIAQAPPHADAFSARGVALDSLGRAPEAEAAYSRALELNPAHPTALNNRGLIRLASRRAEEALADFDALATNHPQLPQAHNNRATALLTLGRAAEALPAAQRALELMPDHLGALRNRGHARLGTGDRAGGLADLRAALTACAPTDPLRPTLIQELQRLGAAPR